MSEKITLPNTPYFSSEEFYKICRINKETARRLIKEGLIPAIDLQKQSHRYLIARQDVEHYLADREKNPEKYGYAFRTYGSLGEYDPERARRLRELVNERLSDMPEMLCVGDVAQLLGYRADTIYHWRRKLGLFGCKVSGRLLFPKNGVLKFVESPEFHSVQQKSKIHYELLRRVFDEEQ